MVAMANYNAINHSGNTFRYGLTTGSTNTNSGSISVTVCSEVLQLNPCVCGTVLHWYYNVISMGFFSGLCYLPCSWSSHCHNSFLLTASPLPRTVFALQLHWTCCCISFLNKPILRKVSRRHQANDHHVRMILILRCPQFCDLILTNIHTDCTHSLTVFILQTNTVHAVSIPLPLHQT